MVKNRTKYEVWYEDGYWKVGKVGAFTSAVSKHKKKSTALKKGRKIAKRNKPSSLRIKNKENQIMDESTYPRESDPFPPRG